MQKLDGSGSYTVSLSGLLAELEADLGAGFFGPGATGSATVTINPEDECMDMQCAAVRRASSSASFAASCLSFGLGLFAAMEC